MVSAVAQDLAAVPVWAWAAASSVVVSVRRGLLRAVVVREARAVSVR